MNPITTLLATAAVTAGTIQVTKALRRHLKKAPDQVKWLKKRRSGRVDGVTIDLEADEKGIYAVRQADGPR